MSINKDITEVIHILEDDTLFKPTTLEDVNARKEKYADMQVNDHIQTVIRLRTCHICSRNIQKGEKYLYVGSLRDYVNICKQCINNANKILNP